MKPYNKGNRVINAAGLLLLLCGTAFSAQNDLPPGGVPSMSERFESNGMDDPDSYVVVDDKAVEFRDPSELEVGKAPSAEQLANLKEDMVWIKKEKIAGFEIYIPEVYLAGEE